MRGAPNVCSFLPVGESRAMQADSRGSKLCAARSCQLEQTPVAAEGEGAYSSPSARLLPGAPSISGSYRIRRVNPHRACFQHGCKKTDRFRSNGPFRFERCVRYSNFIRTPPGIGTHVIKIAYAICWFGHIDAAARCLDFLSVLRGNTAKPPAADDVIKRMLLARFLCDGQR